METPAELTTGMCAPDTPDFENYINEAKRSQIKCPEK